MKRFLLIAAIIAVMVPVVAQENAAASDSTVSVNAAEKAASKSKDNVKAGTKRSQRKMTLKAGPASVVVDLPSDTTVVSEEILDEHMDEAIDEAMDEVDAAFDDIDDAFDDLDDDFSHRDRKGRLWSWVENMTEGGFLAVSIISLVLIFLSFVFPLIAVILIAWLIIRYRQKRNRERDELIKDLADKGQDVSSYFKQQAPQNVVYRTESTSKQSARKVKRPLSNKQMYDKGVTNSIIGGVITVVCAVYHWPSLFILGGLILLGLGVSQIIRGKSQDEYIDVNPAQTEEQADTRQAEEKTTPSKPEETEESESTDNYEK